MEETEKVKVVVRCRPMSEAERQAGHREAVIVDPHMNTIQLTNEAGAKEDPIRSFAFDAVFGAESDQLRVYNVAARPIVDNVLKGYNGTIFAYGQTGTGKTFTMAGDLSRPELYGIIPNSFAHIFDHISKQGDDKTFLVRVSYLEIYNEEIRDLLTKDGNGGPLEMKERADVGVYVKNLSSVTVSSASHMHRIMQFGNKNRKVASTKMNTESSRSHAVFTVTVEASEAGHVTSGKLQLVDLAGSERQAKTGASGDTLKEAAKINLSLSTLGNVISALVDAKATHIPYRNSKLTRLLQHSLGGNSKTVMCANVGPASYNYDESLSTLRYANRAKNIQNAARINEDPKDALLRKFQQEIEQLKKMLAEEEDVEDDGNLTASMEELRRAKGSEAWDAKMRSMEASLAERMSQLETGEGMDDEERRRMAEELMERDKELKRARSEHESLRAKLEAIESKLIVGGENMLEKAEQQARLLEESNDELQRAREGEELLRSRLRQREAERFDMEEKFGSLQEEATAKSHQLRRVWVEWKEVKAELADAESEHQREVEGTLQQIRDLRKQLLLNMTIVEQYIPPEYLEMIERYVSWNEEIGDWQLRAIAYTGNNMRPVKPQPTPPQPPSSNQTVPLFYSYKNDCLGGSASSSGNSTKSAKKERNAARLKALLS